MAKTPDPIDVHVGSRVRARRVLLGMSQEKLGDALGLTFQQVQKYEKGANRIGASRLQQIATALNVEPSLFFVGAPPAGAPVTTAATTIADAAAVFLTGAEALRLGRAFAAIGSARQRRALVLLAEAMVEEGGGGISAMPPAAGAEPHPLAA